jgi:hypothetical protein
MSRVFKVIIEGIVDVQSDPLKDLHDWVGSSPFDWKKVDIDVKSRYKNPSQKGGNFERAFCKRLSNWVSSGVDDSIFWRATGSGGWSTRKKSEMQIGDITCFPEKVSIGGWLTDTVVLELKNRNLELGDVFKVPFQYLQDLIEKCIASQVQRIPLVIMKSEGCLVSLSIRQLVDCLGEDFPCYLRGNNFALFDFRDILDIPVEKVKPVWQQLLGE